MVKVLAITLTIAGMVGLVIGVMGLFGKNLVSFSPWAFSILGLIFFFAGIGLLKKT